MRNVKNENREPWEPGQVLFGRYVTESKTAAGRITELEGISSVDPQLPAKLLLSAAHATRAIRKMMGVTA